jgi:hypothetical protein
MLFNGMFANIEKNSVQKSFGYILIVRLATRTEREDYEQNTF